MWTRPLPWIREARRVLQEKIEGFIATDREAYRTPLSRPTWRSHGQLPQGATRVDRMRRKLQTKVDACDEALLWATLLLR